MVSGADLPYYGILHVIVEEYGGTEDLTRYRDQMLRALEKGIDAAGNLGLRRVVVCTDGFRSGNLSWEEAEKAALAMVKMYLKMTQGLSPLKEIVIVTSVELDNERKKGALALMKSEKEERKDWGEERERPVEPKEPVPAPETPAKPKKARAKSIEGSAALRARAEETGGRSPQFTRTNGTEEQDEESQLSQGMAGLGLYGLGIQGEISGASNYDTQGDDTEDESRFPGAGTDDQASDCEGSASPSSVQNPPDPAYPDLRTGLQRGQEPSEGSQRVQDHREDGKGPQVWYVGNHGRKTGLHPRSWPDGV
ncbi:uncharacterized protein AKAME5_001701800 [Lates japonicus]|nr:uncharacterized protein AKAME5_001701800 [Lates japonicus]